LKARYTRDVLESTAVELITPNLLEAADYEAEGERGQDFENHLHCLDFPILEPPWHLRVTQSFLRRPSTWSAAPKNPNGGLRSHQRSAAKKATARLYCGS